MYKSFNFILIFLMMLLILRYFTTIPATILATEVMGNNSTWEQSYEAIRKHMKKSLSPDKKSNCEKLLSEILAELDSMNHCNKDNDCTLIDQDPFGDAVPYPSKIAKSIRIKMKDYHDHCDDTSFLSVDNDFVNIAVCWKKRCMGKTYIKDGKKRGRFYPFQVIGSVIFGHYKLLPPKEYWYLPGKFPKEFTKSKDSFLITFWKDKNREKSYQLKKNGKAFFNFSVSKNEYADFDAFYKNAKSFGMIYKNLPKEAKVLENIDRWSCKYLIHGLHGLHGLACITLRDNLIMLAVYGPDIRKVLDKASLLKDMVKSFTILNN